MSIALQFRRHAEIDSLHVGECTMHRGATASARWWLLWARVACETDGSPLNIAIPVIPGGVYTENGPGGRTWGLTKISAGIWAVLPSVNVLAGDGDGHAVVAGHAPTGRSLWHQTPDIVCVPADEPWTQGQPP